MFLNKSVLATSAFLLALTCVPELAFAETASNYGSAEIGSEVSKIQEFLFGYPMKAAAVMGAAFGLGKTYMTGNIMPAVTFGGAGFAGLILPKFINGLFSVSSICISQLVS